jgi:uncharacterized protein YegJ (DUF2314 family)
MAVAVPSDAEPIRAAARQARESLDGFIERLSASAPGQSDFSIKVAVRDGEATHYLWLQDVSYEAPHFRGSLGPDAAGINGHAPGERVEVDRSEVEDWMYVQGGKLVGGFSLRAIRDRLAGKAREQFERSMWFAFE